MQKNTILSDLVGSKAVWHICTIYDKCSLLLLLNRRHTRSNLQVTLTGPNKHDVRQCGAPLGATGALVCTIWNDTDWLTSRGWVLIASQSRSFNKPLVYLQRLINTDFSQLVISVTGILLIPGCERSLSKVSLNSLG